jgi:hypothetical protein
MTNTQDKVTPKTIRDIVQARHDSELAHIAVHDCLAQLIREKWEGKKLNKRLATQLKEKLYPGDDTPVVYYSAEYGMHQIYIWGKSTPWPTHSDRLVIYLAHDSIPSEPKYNGSWSGAINAAGFEHGDCCHGSAAKERNVRRQNLLKDSKTLAAIAIQINQCRAAWKAINDLTEWETDAQPDRYPIIELTGLQEER